MLKQIEGGFFLSKRKVFSIVATLMFALIVAVVAVPQAQAAGFRRPALDRERYGRTRLRGQHHDHRGGSQGEPPPRSPAADQGS